MIIHIYIRVYRYSHTSAIQISGIDKKITMGSNIVRRKGIQLGGGQGKEFRYRVTIRTSRLLIYFVSHPR